MDRRSSTRGFTIIELLIALGITALLLTIGLPSFTTFLRNSEIRSTAESIINGLRTARTEATRRNALIVFIFAGNEDPSWRIRPAVEGAPECQEDLTKVPVQQYSKQEASANAKIAILPPGLPGPAVCFNGLGRIMNQGTAGDHLELIDIVPSVSGAEGRPLRIIVDDMPNAADPTKPRGLRVCDRALPSSDPRAC